MKLTIALILLLSFVCIDASGQYELNHRCLKAYEDIINLRFQDGQLLLNIEKSENPENNIPILLENYIDFLTIIISEEEGEFISRKILKDQRIEILESGDLNSPYYLFSLAQINLQWAFVRIKFGEYVRAAMEIRKSYHYLERNIELHPDFRPNMLAMGMMHVLVGSVPDKYKWIAGLFSMKGSIENGVEEINAYIAVSANNENGFLFPEALFFLGFVHMNLLADVHKPIPFEEEYDSLSGFSPVISYAYGRLLMSKSRNEDAIRIFKNAPRGDNYFSFFYLDYLTGLCLLHKLDPGARKYFYAYVSNFKGKNYIREAYQRIAWSYLISGDSAGYHSNINKILRYGFAETDGDKLALKEAESGDIPNVALLKARMLFDGGYFKESRFELDSAVGSLSCMADSAEWFYRFGRVYDSWGKYDLAEEYYLKTIDFGESLKKYFAANAALKLGNIYEMRGAIREAEFMYRRCKNMDFDEYETSIKQKAKAGLNRISDY